MGKKYKQRNGAPVRVLCIDNGCPTYPVVAATEEGALFMYTAEGKFHSDTNLLSGIDLVEDTPYADFKVDDKVMVRDADHHTWNRRYFSHINSEGFPVCFSEGVTSWVAAASSFHSTFWKQCRKPTAEELGE